MRSKADWPSPEHPHITELPIQQQELYNAIVVAAGSDSEPLLTVWDKIHAVVFRVAGPVVPYSPDQDTYHAPTTSVWQAAWTAGLIGLCLYTDRQVPQALTEQWKWYLKGHWPCGYAICLFPFNTAPLVLFIWHSMPKGP